MAVGISSLDLGRNALYAFGLPAAVGLIWLRQPLVSALLERGAFNAQSTQATSWALMFYALGLVGHAVVEIVTRAFYALHDTRTPVIVGISTMAANVGLSLGFMALFRAVDWQPHGGLALANSLATTAEMVVLWGLISRRLERSRDASPTGALWRMGAGCLAMLAVLVALTSAMAAAPAWLISGAGIVAGGAIYGLVTLALGSQEPVALMRALRRRLSASDQ